jgi:hypothetical protein
MHTDQAPGRCVLTPPEPLGSLKSACNGPDAAARQHPQSPSVPVVQWPRTSPFHGGNTGSNPVGDATLACVATHAKSLWLVVGERGVILDPDPTLGHRQMHSRHSNVSPRGHKVACRSSCGFTTHLSSIPSLSFPASSKLLAANIAKAPEN